MYNVKYDSEKKSYFAFDDEEDITVLGVSSECKDTQENELLYYAQFIAKQNNIALENEEVMEAVCGIQNSEQLKKDYEENSKEETVSVTDYYKRVLFNFVVFGDTDW